MAVVVGRNTVKRKMGGDNQYYEETEGHGRGKRVMRVLASDQGSGKPCLTFE